MEYTASTTVPKTYTHHDVMVARAQGVEIGWLAGLIFVICVYALASTIRNIY